MCYLEDYSHGKWMSHSSSKIAVVACASTFNLGFPLGRAITLQLSTFFNLLSPSCSLPFVPFLDPDLLCSFACKLQGSFFDFCDTLYNG